MMEQGGPEETLAEIGGLGWLGTHAAQLHIPTDKLGSIEVHVHVPAGAIPKDGPSAGVSISTALVSAMSGRKVRKDVAMTGEATLRGRVLPIGGLKEKVLGAHRAGITTIILPKDNEKDLADIPQEILASLTVHFVEIMDEVLRIALERPIVPLELSAVAPVAEPFVGGTEKDKSLTN